ncbi:helix-turn-helix domain-containing protein [Streptomyces olivochromogenes]|uniref:helix-turn-helix domain-containing protein n=1 Tax=Streptomyces olivochromogenes TaxID=1963 RepID=UPI001F1E45B3|nr:helix-turn-helix transcriptional regulator [Streptomyces olivochromogenes]MCF3136286.1 helix-turn-helix transcriptional regulator [Streptomyces olivochromogenes]
MQSPYPSAALDEARRTIAERLREIRRDAGLTGREVAERAGWQPSKVSRLQSATTPPSDDDIRAWCRACGAENQIPDLLAANRTADSMYLEWRRVQRSGLRRLQESRVPLYERTETFRVYSSTVIPGFVQTHEYAAALLGNIARVHGTPDDVEDAAVARVERSHIIREGRHRFAFLLEESVLRHVVGEPAVMAGQLGYLLSVMALPAVSVGIIPAGRQRPMWTLETFTMFDEERVSVELLTAAITVTAPGELAMYAHAFEEMASLAVVGADARGLISSAIDALG